MICEELSQNLNQVRNSTSPQVYKHKSIVSFCKYFLYHANTIRINFHNVIPMQVLTEPVECWPQTISGKLCL